MLLLGFPGTDVVFAAMQRAAGTDWLVDLAEKLLRRNPRYITYLAPVVTYTMIILAGTGHTVLATTPVIAEVSKEGRCRPRRGLPDGGHHASPISVASCFSPRSSRHTASGISSYSRS